MIRLTAVLALLGALLPISPVAAHDLCTSTAHVSWDIDVIELTITGVRVDLPGCSDGDPVGIQVLTDDGDIPADAPLMGAVSDERALFDVTQYALRVEPVTGVRVFLERRGDEPYTWQITVDRRFFNPAGNEQVGLRDLTVLQVPHLGSYRVEGAPTRYRETSCAEFGYEPSDAIAEGSGTFADVTAGGRHIACFQQVTPGRGPASDAEVLEEVLERDPDDRTEVLGAGLERPSSPGSRGGVLGRLAMTGNDLLLATAIGFATLGVGLGLLRRRRA
jgi:hypothetical protein